MNSASYASLYQPQESGSSGSDLVNLPPTAPVRVKATIINYGDHTYWTASDTKSFMFANSNVKFSLDNNYKLIAGTQSISFSGLTTLQNFIQDANQSPNAIYGGTSFLFTITGSTIVSGISFDTTISITGDISTGTIDFSYFFR